MIFALMLIGTTLGSVHSALTPVTGSQMDGFVTSFRQTLLEKIAVETNSTVIAAEALKSKMENECQPKLQAKIANCKLCAKDKCQSAPSFDDLLKLANPLQYLQGPLDSIASKINDAKDLLGIKIAPFVNSMKNLGAAIPDTISNVFNKLKAGLDAVYKALHLDNIGNIATNIGNLIADDLNKIKDFFTGRRRKRSTIDPKVKACMQQCDTCIPLLAPTNEEIIAGVCGQDIVNMNATIVAQMKKIQNVYNHVVDKVNTIVKALNIDVSTMQNLQLHDVEVTWFVNGLYKSHKATKPVPFLDMSTNLALEFWDNYPLTV